MKTIIFWGSFALALLVFSIPTTLSLAIPVHSPAVQSSNNRTHTKVFTGTIVKKGDGFVLSDSANKLSYKLDDAQKASEFEGKKVKVTGTVDAASNTIHVETIEEVV